MIGFDLPFLNKFAMQLTKVLNYTHIDVSKLQDVHLLDNIDTPLVLDNPYAENREKWLLNQVSNKENVVVTLPITDFIANDNYKILNNSFIILVSKNNTNKLNIDENLNNFIKKRVDLVLKQENLEINEILKKIKGD